MQNEEGGANELLQNGGVGILIAGMHKEAGANERVLGQNGVWSIAC